jgi:riboflavin transporter 2
MEQGETGCLAKARNINPLIVALVMCFAFSSWIDMIGVYVQLPIIVHILPEGWTLPSYVIVLIQCAMITPLIYTAVNKLCPGNTHRREVFMAYFIMSVGFVALLLLSIFWKYTVFVAGADRSIPALTLIFLLAMVDTTSCIVYLPYMSRFKADYIPAYVAGEELGGLLTGIVGLIQGAGGEAICNNVTVNTYNATLGLNFTESHMEMTHKEPRFSVSVFFLFLMSLMAVSTASFSILNFSKFAKKRDGRQVCTERKQGRR